MARDLESKFVSFWDSGARSALDPPTTRGPGPFCDLGNQRLACSQSGLMDAADRDGEVRSGAVVRAREPAVKSTDQYTGSSTAARTVPRETW